MDNKRKPVHNSTYPKSLVSCTPDSFVVKGSSMLQMNICAEKTTHRKARKCYASFKMKTENSLILIILLTTLGCSSKTENQQKSYNSNDSAIIVKDTIKTLSGLTLNFIEIEPLLNKKVTISKVDSSSYPDHKIFHFEFTSGSYKSMGDYGRGIALTKNDSIITWKLEYGDYTSHTFNWIDFDNDGDNDLYTFAGEEEYFSSRLYLNVGDSLKEIYNNTLCYCPLIDINNDGTPEILNTNNSAVVEVDYDSELNLTDDQQSKISKEYDAIVGKFDQNNFKYNMPKFYKLFSMDILSSVTILELANGELIDVSKDYPEHFCFRIELLQSIESPSKRVVQVVKTLTSEYRNICKKE